MSSFWDQGPSKNIRFLLFAVIGCGIPLLIVGPFLSMAMKSSGGQLEGRYDSICLSRLGQIGKAMTLYTGDFDNRYPPAGAWIDATWSYILEKDPKETTENPYQCPTIAKMRTGEFGYSMNDRFGSQPFDDSGDEWTSEPLVFDSDELGRNSHATIGSLCLPPRHDEHKSNNGLYPNLTAKRIPKQEETKK